VQRPSSWVRSWFKFWFSVWWLPIRFLTFLTRAAREVLGWRRRAEVAEAVAAERHRTIELLTATLQSRTNDDPKLNGDGPARRRRGLTTGGAADS
jgi:hypothetical protein